MTRRSEGRSRSREDRQKRAVLTTAAAIVVVVVVMALLVVVPGPGSVRAGQLSPRPFTTRPIVPRKGVPQAAVAPSGPPAVESGTLPWQLAAPVSREVVLPVGTANNLLIAGGLDSAGSSASGVYALDTLNGRLSLVGSLPVATHDAAGAVTGHGSLVFGGGNTVPISTTQGIATGGSPLASGSLPEARADSAAVTISGTAFVVGGYNGLTLDPEVLATTDGLHFDNVAALAVPVRYPAVAALNGKIYVFGGQGSNGRPVGAVQVVDPVSRRVSVIGQLPSPVTGAVAMDLGGTLYVAGGESGVGTAPLRPVTSIFAFDAVHRSFLRAGSLRLAVSNAAATVLGTRGWVVGGEVAGGAPTATVQMLEPNLKFGTAGSPGAGSPYFGEQLLVADRGNNRLLVLNDAGQVLWTYPSAHAAPPPGGFYFPDDAFFARHGTAIISNQEENDTVVLLAYPSGRLLWSYGHPRAPGSAPGYLNNPDDAYLLENGEITVADPMNCRVLVISPQKRVLSQIGTVAACAHNPPTGLGSPNGDTPLANGDLLISEINGSWVDEYTPSGHLVWDVQLPIGYPSDPQPLGRGTYLVADYENPGAIIEFDRQGRILYRYQPTSGPGTLYNPSLVEMLPSGVFMLNDDYNDRMVAIDPGTGALVWQYGVTGETGTAAGFLNTPDGFDVLGPNGSTPTHPATG